MAIQKAEYELSVWNEELIDGIKKESKGIIIGAHDMTYLGRATSIKFVRSKKGTNILTFQMPTKYFDSELGKYVKNELIEDLYDERKLKLFYKKKWYEFYIKKIEEKKQFKSIMKTFTCTDSFIDELSRTGYEIEFAAELNNSVEEIGIFMETPENSKIKNSSKAILDDSIWDYRPEMNIGDFTEFTEQRFYKIPLSQFGGSIKGYPINLKVDKNDFKAGSEEEKENRSFLINPYTYEKRSLEYGDDQARVEELFWDPYKDDNGHILLNDNNLTTLTGDYIYVPITDLSFIMGSVYKNASISLDEPALYKFYNENKNNYALQPNSENPRDLIQFIYFDNGEEVKIDETGTIINKNCHYVITIEQWNSILEKQFKNTKNGVIYWISPFHEEDDNYSLSPYYSTNTTIINGEKYIYTTNVYPNTRTIDNFNWYPVYYEGYLSQIANEEVSLARKISIADRTELNLNSDIYVKVYNQKDIDFKDLYSEKELNDLIKRREELRKKKVLTAEEKEELEKINIDFRVCSKLNTRLVLPTLARNMVENGQQITDTNGWEAKTQNLNHDYFDTGSYRKMLEINIQQTVQTDDNNNLILDAADLTGGTSDEGVSDYYLELLSPCISKGDNITAEGETITDYAVNFGIVGQEKKIEKDKIYAIRLTTGTWHIIDYNFTLRATDESMASGDEPISFTEKEVSSYKSTFDLYRQLIIQLNNDKPSGVLKDSTKYQNIQNKYNTLCKSEYINTLKNDPNDLTAQKEVNKKLYEILVSLANYKTSGKEYEKTSNIAKLLDNENTTLTNSDYNNTDLIYLKYQLLTNVDNLIENINTSDYNSFYSATYLSDSIVKNWKETYIITNSTFEKKNNVDLDKIIIGEGSTNLQGNYTIDGIDNTKGNFINFSDLAEIENTALVFLPKGNDSINNKKYLTEPLYYKRKKKQDNISPANRWEWSDSKTDNNYYYVEDNAYLLFKAKKTIENPYIAIKVKSGPAQINFDKIEQNIYVRNSGAGVKICAADTISEQYGRELKDLLVDQFSYIDGDNIEIYEINENNFSEEFLNSVHYDKEKGTIGINASDTSSYGELKNNSLKEDTKTLTWSSSTSLTTPNYFSQLKIKEDNSKKTFGYALFVNNVYYGVFWLNKNKQEVN